MGEVEGAVGTVVSRPDRGRDAPRIRSAGTERGYAEAWSRFTLWCAVGGVPSLPASPTTVVFYLAHLAPVWRPATAVDPPEAVVLAGPTGRQGVDGQDVDGRGAGGAWGEVCQRPGLAIGSLVRHLAAISAHHLAAGFPSPTRDRSVLDALSRIRRRAAAEVPRRVAAQVPVAVQGLVAGLDVEHDPAAARDAALILLGYAAALRRAEVAALTVDQVREDPAGDWVEVSAAPADPGTAGPVTRIPAVGGDACPVAAWDCWRRWLVAGEQLSSSDDGLLERAPAFRQIRKGRPGAGTAAFSPVAARRIGVDALTERSIARIVSARSQQA